MTTTLEAIQSLTGIKNNLKDELNGKQAQLDSVNLAISQLEGILDTPSADLAASDEALGATKEELLKTKANLVKANDRIAVLEAQVSAPPVPPPQAPPPDEPPPEE